MKHLTVLIIIIAVGIIAVLGGTFYMVYESQQVIITQFGKPVDKPISTPGLHVKLPFVQKTNYFDNRFLAWDGDPNQIPTKDKRFIWVDTYARWRIADPLLFFQRLRDERGAKSRLDDILDGETRNAVAKHRLIELVRSKSDEDSSELNKILFGREILATEVLQNASLRTADLGIEILDFKFKRINYVEDVRREVYARMISERQRIAEEYRSEGAGEAARIDGDRQRELKVITSEAYRKSKEIKGKADAEASDIYASAYNKSPDLYRFLRTMDTYKTVMDAQTTLVISTEGDFLGYLKSSQ